MRDFILDPSGENVAADKYIIVDNEISLLRGLNNNDSLLVQGNRLCDWASSIAEARSISTVLFNSPSNELTRLLPSFSIDKSKFFFEVHSGKFNGLKTPINIMSISKKLWPDSDLWDRALDNYHALSWLLFIDNTDFTDIDQEFVSAFAISLVDSAPHNLKHIYSATKHTAWPLLLEWTKSKSTNRVWPSFADIELPVKLIQHLQEEWRTNLIRTEGLFFEEYISREPNIKLIRKVAHETVDYYYSNPLILNRRGFDTLRPFVKLEDNDKLLLLLPPDDPGSPPKEFAKVIHWFTHSYLPFRKYSQSSNDSHSHARLKEITKTFSFWFLDYYVSARAGGEGAEYFSWSKTSELGSLRNDVTLLVVLDGLGYRDAEFIQKNISELSSRIAVEDFDIVISPLPTVTEFAKKALMAGLPPSNAIKINEQIGVRERGAPAVINSLNEADPGDVVIWSLVEPDSIYHQKSDALSICQEVHGWLQGFSRRVVDVAHKVKDSQKLKIVITTDHGRLLSSSKRSHEVPTGMKAHGRAAWGGLEKEFGKNGYLVEGNIAYLHPDRFGVPEVCAIILNDESFKMVDGRGGNEFSPHGGIYPEEVLIPWLAMCRDQSDVNLDVGLSGRGIAGSNGTYDLEIINPGSVRVQFIELTLSLSDQKISLDLEIKGMGKVKKQIHTKHWPKNSEAETLFATLQYRLPSGESRRITVRPVIEIVEMYQQDDILTNW